MDDCFILAGAAGTWTASANSSPATLNTNTWYTAETQVINDSSGNPVIDLYVYSQGGTRPAVPTLTWTDTSKKFLSGYFGLGVNNTLVSYDNVIVGYNDNSALNITTPARSVSTAPNVATLAITDEGGTFYIPYIQTSTTLSVSATAGASYVPSGGGVEFVLNQGLSGQQTLYSVGGSSPYSVNFTNLAKGTYTLDAYIVDSNKVVQSGAYNHDSETDIGIGDIITAIGDSITAGYPVGVGQVSNWVQSRFRRPSFF